MSKRNWVALALIVLAMAACGGGGGGGGGGGSSGSALQITTTTLPNGALNLAYNATINATASGATYTWSVTGTLPPGLALDTLATGYTTTLTGTPTSAGTYNFDVNVDASGLSASRPYTVTISASGFPSGTLVTDVTVSNTVRVSNVKRLGLNVGGHDRWGAGKILKNQLPNPGFEAGVFGTVWLADSSSTNNLYVPRDWNVSTGSQPSGFWDGAEYEIVYGPGAGTSGTVSAFTHNGSNYNFDLGSNGAVSLNDRDVMFTRRTFTGTQGMNGGVGTADTSNPYSGTQSLRLAPGDNFDYVQDTAWRDGDQSSHKLIVVEGDWRIRLKARAANAGDQVQVRLYRDGGAPYNPTFMNQTFNLTGSWATYTFDQTVAAGADQTPDPWPTGTYRPALIFAIDVPGGNAGNVWIDEVELYRVDDATNPTAFSDRFVGRLQDYNAGVLRWWAGQLGETLENMTRSWQDRGTCGYKPSSTTPGTWNYGVPDFLELCDYVGAEPWIVMPPTASQQDLLNFMEYLAGTSGTYATRRINQGQTAPWTSVFNKIHLEWGNELWGAGTPGDPFGGASVSGGVRLGNLADRAFTMMKGSSWYAGAAANLDFIIGGQSGYAGRQQEIEANANDHDSTALAPYFGTLTSFASDAQMYLPLFAHPIYEALNCGGMSQSKGYLTGGGNGTELSIYEVNYHTTQIISGLPTSLRNEFVAGASGAIALPLNMLVYMTELGAVNQCAFLACGYSFRFDTSGGWPPQQDQFVQVWGMLRDMYHYDIRRPTWMGVELANKAIMGDAITTTQTGDNPNWTQSAINGVGAPTTVNEVQSFAFRNGNQYGIVLMNLSLTQQQGIRLHVPGTPQANATIHMIEPANINDMNTTSEVVTLDTQAVSNFQDAYEMLMPPHSIRAVVWSD
ncbi:MAG: hypothetical protein H6839_03480 [Planctomycetes bacterium]|nr:hypothetical protein [Planctomycetota bacterium]